jgi:AcrR family transcriptional regulator
MTDLGLRARKRLAAMRHIQATAFELFEREGFDGVTIEQIARTAEVSPSSVYRYFGTKEQLVLWDEYDPAAFGLFAEELQGHPPLDAMRRAVAAVGESFLGPDRERVERMVDLAYEEPSVHAAMGQQLAEAAQAIAAMIGARYDRDPHDLEVQVVASTLVGAIEVSFRNWHRCGFERPIVELMDEAFELLARGLELR